MASWVLFFFSHNGKQWLHLTGEVRFYLRVGRRITPFFVQKEVQMQQLKIIFDGTPDVYALLASEQKVFFSTLLERIIALKQEKDN